MSASRTGLFVVGVVVSAAVAGLGADPPRTDALGDPLPPGAIARLGTTRSTISVDYGPALPPGYTTYAIGYQEAGLKPGRGEKKVAIRDAATGRILVRHPAGNTLGTGVIAASADGKRVVTWVSGTATIWDPRTGARLAEFRPDRPTPNTPTAGTTSLFSTSADGTRLAVGSSPPPPRPGVGGANPLPGAGPAGATATVWDVDRKEKLASVTVADPFPLAPALSPDGKTLATWSVVPEPATPVAEMLKPGGPRNRPPDEHAELARTIRVWDVPAGKEISRVRLSMPRPTAVAFSPDGKTLAACAESGPVELWDARTGEPKPLLGGAPLSGGRLAFSPDGKTLAAVGRDGVARRWATADGRPLGETPNPIAPRPLGALGATPLGGIGFADNDRAVVWARCESVAVLWEVPSGKLLTPLGEHTHEVRALVFSADGKELTTYQTGQAERLVRWNLATAKPVRSVAVRDGQKQPAGAPPAAPAGSAPERVSVGQAVYDAATGERLFLVTTEQGGAGVYAHASVDRTRVAVFPQRSRPTRTQSCEVWDLTAPRRVARVDLARPAGFGGNFAAAISPDNRRLVTAAVTAAPPRVAGQPVPSPTLLITGWDLATGKKLGEVEVPDVRGSSIAIAAVSRTTAVFTDGSAPLRAVDYEAGRLGDVIDDAVRDASVNPAVSPDGTKFAAVAGGPTDRTEVRVYGWPRGRPLRTFTGHTANITSLAFSPDGKVLASGSRDTTVLLWDLTAK